MWNVKSEGNATTTGGLYRVSPTARRSREPHWICWPRSPHKPVAIDVLAIRYRDLKTRAGFSLGRLQSGAQHQPARRRLVAAAILQASPRWFCELSVTGNLRPVRSSFGGGGGGFSTHPPRAPRTISTVSQACQPVEAPAFAPARGYVAQAAAFAADTRSRWPERSWRNGSSVPGPGRQITSHRHSPMSMPRGFANGGALPPDLSLIHRPRSYDGFPKFVFDFLVLHT